MEKCNQINIWQIGLSLFMSGMVINADNAKKRYDTASHNSPYLCDLNRSYKEYRDSFLLVRLRLVILLGLLAYGTFLALGVLNLSNQTTHEGEGWILMASTVEISLLIILLVLKSKWGSRNPHLLFICTGWVVTLTEQVWASLQSFALPGVVSWTLVFLTFAAIIPVRWILHLVVQVGVLGYFFGVNNYFGFTQRQAPQIDILYQLYLFWFCSICTLGVYLYERLQRSEFVARKEVEIEQVRTQTLLLNILPETIVAKLKEGDRIIADSFNNASVLFADLVGFTELSLKVHPREMVDLLNQIFSAFDELTEKYHLEKIKTIGDAYMVVSGVPLPRDDHALVIAQMALDMREKIFEFNEEKNQSFKMRIGINSGPVVAGVIGIKRFSYDLWGDTVNIASHLESHSVPDAIHLSSTTYELIKDHYITAPRGFVQIKGKGSMETYFLTGRIENG